MSDILKLTDELSHVAIPTAVQWAAFIHSEAAREIDACCSGGGAWAPEDTVNDIARAALQRVGRVLQRVVDGEPWYVAKPSVELLAKELQRLEPGMVIR